MDGNARRLFAALSCILGSMIGCGDSDSSMPTCAPDTLVSPELEDPPMWGVVPSVTPNLEWTYPTRSCSPQLYDITLYRGGPPFRGFTVTSMRSQRTSPSPPPPCGS